MPSPHAIIIAARRTPIGRVGGSLKSLPVEALMAPVLNALVQDADIDPHQVNEVILGNAVGPGGNPARLALLTAGFPVTVAGVTVDRQCGSGLEAINLAARLIQAGAGDIYIAGGVESVSTAPWRIDKPRSLYELPQFTHRARFAPEAIGDPDMGVAAETVAQTYHISRDRQDEYAVRSHQHALASIYTGRFHDEIVPIHLSAMTVVDTDECPRPNLTVQRLGKLPPAFQADGTVTVGNACPINDGAAAVLMVSDRLFRSMKVRSGLRVVDAVAAGVDPTILGMGPVAAIRKLLNRHPHLKLNEIERIEFNEAFAAQVLACLDCLDISHDIVNVGGGAIALGHPYGASGAILVTRLFTELVRRHHANGSAQRGLATLGIGGGLGLATLFDYVSSTT
ncbi:MAG: thiolase family protein [Elainellaceae cyanobacterium]